MLFRSDVALHHLYPEIDWLEVVDREHAARSRTKRVARRVNTALPAAIRTPLLCSAARIAFACGGAGLSHRLLSLAYEAIYRESLAGARRESVAWATMPASHSEAPGPEARAS